MNAIVAVAFNLIGNSLLSFVVALGLVSLAQRLLRLRPGRLRLALWLVPFVKVLWELGRGIPARSFVWVHALGAKQDLGSFQLGFGLERARPPFVRALLAAHSSGLMYTQSAPDLLFRGLSLKLSPWLPLLIVIGVVSTSLLRLLRRAASVHAFRRRTRALLRSATLYTSERAARRSVRVYSSPEHEGAPFAAGVAHPFVVFSGRSLQLLGEPARNAAIQHELAHIDRHDPSLILALLYFTDAFWFLPGSRRLSLRILSELELCADQRAVQRGATPAALADALVSVGEQLVTPHPALGLSGGKSLLRERVERLCRPESALSRGRRLAALLAVLLLASSVLYSVFFGN